MKYVIYILKTTNVIYNTISKLQLKKMDTVVDIPPPKILNNDKEKIKDLKLTNKQSEDANSHKEISQNLLNINIVQSQIGILVNVYWLGCEDGMCKTIISLIIISFVLQGLIFMLVTWLFYVDSSYKYKIFSSEFVNGIVTFLSGLSLVINCSISAVGLKIPSLNITK